LWIVVILVIIIIALIAMLIVLQFRAGGASPSPASPSAVASPTKTPSASSTPTPTPTPEPSPTETSTPGPTTLTLTPLGGDESGSIFDGSAWGTEGSPTIIAGDHRAGAPWVGFASIDITGLAGREIVSAKLDLSAVNIVHSPFTLGTFRIGDLQYGNMNNALASKNLPPDRELYTSSSSPPAMIEVTDALKARLAEGRTHFQVRVKFDNESNGDLNADQLWWDLPNFKLVVTYR